MEWDTILGLVGKPNAGKSTFFEASTSKKVEIANYPFTTINSNKGFAYIRDRCPHEDFGIRCDPQDSRCVNGTRLVPVKILDVAGLVPDAYKGKGLGNEFLDQLRQADSLIHVVDASGSTDKKGNPIEEGKHDPIEDIKFLSREIQMWVYGILMDRWDSFLTKAESHDINIENEISNILTGIGMSVSEVKRSINSTKLSRKDPAKWDDSDIYKLVDNVVRNSKPMLISANKADKTSKKEIKKIKESCNLKVIPTSANSELALIRASNSGLIEYIPGDSNFKILEKNKLSQDQLKGLEFIKDQVLKKFGSTGVQECIEYSVRNLLNMIVVYPVADHNKLTDTEGNKLPEAYLLKKGSTAKDLAYKLHSDIGDSFLYGVDARTGMRISEDSTLNNGSVIEIVTT